MPALPPVAPDADSLQRGWCGELRRFLRKVEPEQATAPAVVVRLRVGQPVLFFDDFYVASRTHTVRTLLMANCSFTPERAIVAI